MKNVLLLMIVSFLFLPLHAEDKVKKLSSFHLPFYSEKGEYNFPSKKKVVINFWATWCTSCIKELPLLEELKRKNPEVEFLAINAGDSKVKIKKFLKKNPFSYQVLMDKDKSFSKSLGILSLPQTLVVDKTGKVLYHSDKPPKDL